MAVNISFITNATDPTIVGIGGGIDQASGGIFGLSLVLTIFFISYSTTIGRAGNTQALMVASFITALATLILRLLEWVNNDAVFFGTMVLAAGMFVLLAIRDRNLQ